MNFPADLKYTKDHEWIREMAMSLTLVLQIMLRANWVKSFSLTSRQKAKLLPKKKFLVQSKQ